MDYEQEDRHALTWGTAAVKFSGTRPTISDICEETKIRLPFSHSDLCVLKILCERWGIVPNIANDPCWLDLQGPALRAAKGES